MLGLALTVNVVWIGLACLVFALAGFFVRSVQIGNLRTKLEEMEKEMLQNHAQILALQKENIQLEDKMKNNPVPVIPITSKEATETTVDTNHRKKLLAKPANT